MTCSGTSIKKEESYTVLASYDEMYIAGSNMVKINYSLLISNSVNSCRSYINSRKHYTFLSSCCVAGLVSWLWFCFVVSLLIDTFDCEISYTTDFLLFKTEK